MQKLKVDFYIFDPPTASPNIRVAMDFRFDIKSAAQNWYETGQFNCQYNCEISHRVLELGNRNLYSPHGCTRKEKLVEIEQQPVQHQKRSVENKQTTC